MGSGAKVIPSYYDNKTFYLGKVPLGLTSIITLVVTVLSMLVLTFPRPEDQAWQGHARRL